MENTKVTYTNGAINTFLFLIFFIMKLTEKCAFWGEGFPRFLKSTEVWWDGWFIVFLPLWIGLPIVIITLIVVIFIKNIK